MNTKTKIISFRASEKERRTLGRFARKNMRAAGLRVPSNKPVNISDFMNKITVAMLDGKIKIPPKALS